jgi:hypothetical protein
MNIGNFDALIKTICNDGYVQHFPYVIHEWKEIPVEQEPELYERVRLAKYVLYKRIPIIGTMLLDMTVIVCDKEITDTMAVDQGRHLFVNPEFAKKELADENDFLFVLAHEAMHIVMLSLFRLGNRNHDIWNIATDAIINWTLVDEGLRPFKEGIVPDKNGRLIIKDKDTKKVVVDVQLNGPPRKFDADMLYDYLIKTLGAHDGPMPPPQPALIWDPKPGDVIFDKNTGTYGQITSVDKSTGVIDVNPLPEDAALKTAETNTPTYKPVMIQGL